MEFVLSLSGGDNIFRVDKTFKKEFKKGKPVLKEIFQVTHFKNRRIINKNTVKKWSMIQPWIRNMKKAGYKIHRL